MHAPSAFRPNYTHTIIYQPNRDISRSNLNNYNHAIIYKPNMRAPRDFRSSYTKTIMYSLTCVYHATLDLVILKQLCIA